MWLITTIWPWSISYKVNYKSLNDGSKGIRKDPSNTWSVYGIATIYADQGDDTKALDWLEKAIKIDPSVKAVAAEQDHFERFHNNTRFKTLVGYSLIKLEKTRLLIVMGLSQWIVNR